MAEDDSQSTSTTSKGKSTSVNFVLLKHILEDDSSDLSEQEEQVTKNEVDQGKESNRKHEEDRDCGPIGRYPVVFSKRCKSKSCQTKLSAFPLFSVPEETEWLSDDEDIPKRKRVVEKRRRRRNSSESKSKNKKEDETAVTQKVPEKTRNSDGTRKEFKSEHQLKETKNPFIQVWIQKKNKLSRQKRRQERKEKRAQRAALEEEERLKSDRFEQSETKVKEWLKQKRKEARKLWRAKHPKVSPCDMTLDGETENTRPPPEYKVIKTLKHRPRSASATGSHSSKDESLKAAKTRANDTSYNQSQNAQNAAVRSRSFERPKTANSIHIVKDKRRTRPKTAKTTLNSETTNSNDFDDSSRPIRLSYDDWLRSKRTQEKKKIIDHRRELIDSHLDAVISKLGKQQVENIMSPKKQVDSGLRNYSRSSTKSPSPLKNQSYKWKRGHDVPRPEPQGCDCPETEHLDTNSDINCESKYIPLSPASQRKKADEFCKEVTEQCDQLQPSIEKVIAILNSEMKKYPTPGCKPGSRTTSIANPTSLSSTENATCSETIGTTLSLPGTVDESQPQSHHKSARPASARPTSVRTTSGQPTSTKTDLVNNTNLTRIEAKKKIMHDMDVLGLCHSDENISNAVAKEIDKNHGNSVAKIPDENLSNNVAKIPDNTSTVRINYFDYGTDVEVPTMSKV